MLDRLSQEARSVASPSPRCQAMQALGSWLSRPRRVWSGRALQKNMQAPRALLPRELRNCVMRYSRYDGGGGGGGPPRPLPFASKSTSPRLKGVGQEKSPLLVDGLAVASDFQPQARPEVAEAEVAEVEAAESAAGLAPAAAQPLLDGLTGWRKRWTVVGLCFAAFVLCNLDRVNMSIAILPMAEQYGWSSATMGLVQSSFFWGYLLTQVAGGVLADRVGGKAVLGLGVLWWSLATAATPAAAQAGLPTLLAARCLMGVGEGVAMPAMNALLAKWVPAGERSRSLALVYSGMFTGSVLGLGASPHVLSAFGWPSVFWSFGSLGVLWYFLWQSSVSSCPSEDPSISPTERAFILANTPPSSQEKAGDIPWGQLLSRKEVWAIILCHFCHNWGLFILLTWMPAYYTQVLGLNLMQSGVLSVMPWVAMAVMANVAGWAADALVARGTSVTTVRKVMQSIGFLGPALFLSQLGSVTSAGGAALCMVASQGLDAFSQAGLYANHQDIGPRYAGVLLGLSNTAGVLAGVVGSLVTGFLLQAGEAGGSALGGLVVGGGWSAVWSCAVALYLLGTVLWLTMSTGERIFD
ncbi:1 [Pleodorina starrii]|nr:1 [Pleodorina starrii] [Pleodorina starrii]